MAIIKNRLLIRKRFSVSVNSAIAPKIIPLKPIPKSMAEKNIPFATPLRFAGVIDNVQDCKVGSAQPKPNPKNAPETAIIKLVCANDSVHIPRNVAVIQNRTSPNGPFSSNHFPANGLAPVETIAFII